ncbi:MAG TPA: hypothetical protein VK611_26875 [Acidimicrobiales bacterium]|nr:hypothetical protein [Acidimicrobiales bacterium]
MTPLRTHPRHGVPAYLSHLGFETTEGGGGGAPNASADNPPKETGKADDSKTPQGDKETDWKAEARKWEGRAKENSKAADEAKVLKDRLDKLTPLEKLAAALGADPAAGPNDVDKLTEKVTTFEKRLAEEQTARYRAEVANEKKLTADQAKWLTGSTRDEMTASADALIAAFPTPEQKPGGNPLHIPQSGTGDSAPKPGSVNAGRDMYRAERDQHKPNQSQQLQGQN